MIFLGIAIPIGILLGLLLFFSGLYNRNQLAAAASGGLDMFTTNFENQLDSVENYLLNLSLNDATFRSLSEQTDRTRAYLDAYEIAQGFPAVLAANDAASDVAVMLEMARLIQLHPLEIGIDFICFDAEDYGVPQWSDQTGGASSWCLGSQYWAANPHVYGYQARFGILMDMVGGRGSTFSKEGYSQRYASQVVDLVWNTAAQLGYGQFFPMRDGGYITDDHVPVNEIAGIPCIDIIPYFTDAPSGFGPTWHTVNDNMEHIDRQVLKAVGQTVIQVIFNENQ